MTGPALLEWLTNSDSPAPPSPSEVVRACAATAYVPPALPTRLLDLLRSGCRLTIRDDGHQLTDPEPHTWVFCPGTATLDDHADSHTEGLELVLERRADGSVVVAYPADGDVHQLKPSDSAVLTMQIGLVWRLARVASLLGAASEGVRALIDGQLADPDAQPGYAASFQGLEATEQYFAYAAALAGFLSACHQVGSGPGGAAAVASVELILAGAPAAAGGSPLPWLPAAWARAELVGGLG